jgi:hypothetical protein
VFGGRDFGSPFRWISKTPKAQRGPEPLRQQEPPAQHSSLESDSAVKTVTESTEGERLYAEISQVRRTEGQTKLRRGMAIAVPVPNFQRSFVPSPFRFFA